MDGQRWQINPKGTIRQQRICEIQSVFCDRFDAALFLNYSVLSKKGFKKRIASMGQMTAVEFVKHNHALLQEVYDGCVKTYSVTFDGFAESLLGHVNHTARSHNTEASSIAREMITQVNASDYCLALGCARGDLEAWDDFVSQYKAFLLATSRCHCQSEVEAQELASSAYAELYGLKHSGAELRESKFNSILAGLLRGWLRAVIYQMAIRPIQGESQIGTTRIGYSNWNANTLFCKCSHFRRSILRPCRRILPKAGN